EIQRVGSDAALRVDVRVVAATNRDLQREVEAGKFRADLFHRLNMYPICVPPLRERRTDIPLLAGHFLDLYRRKLGLGRVRLTSEARAALVAARWPGNVRELDHLLGRAVLRASAGVPADLPIVLGVEHLQVDPAVVATPAAADDHVGQTVVELRGRPLSESVEEFKRTMIRDAVAEHGGNWAAAARSLGMARGNLHHMARRLGLRERE